MILDLLFIAIIVLFALFGLMSGFIKTVISFFGWFISLLIAYLLAKAIANAFLSPETANWLIGDGSLYDKVYNIVPDGLKNMSMESIRTALQSGATDETIKETIRAEASGLLAFASTLIQNAVCKDIYLNSSIETVGQVLALELTYNIYVILVGIIIFFTIRILVMGVSLIFKSRLGAHDCRLWERILGIGAGAVRGFAYACILLMVASYIAGFWPRMKEELDVSKVSVPVTTWVSEITGKMLSGNIEENEKYANMIKALENKIGNEQSV